MSPKRASITLNKIRVLLIHENGLARSAWKKVLSKSGQIVVIDSIETLKFYRLLPGTLPPEIIVASMPILVSGVLRIEHLKAIFGICPKIIILAENKEDVKIAFREGADWAAAEPIDPQDLITQVRALSGEAEKLCAEYRDGFSTIRAGDSQNRKFCDLVDNSFQLVFHPDLVNPEYVTLSSTNSLAGRLVFRNQARGHEFWIDARQMHQSRYITVDIYNKRLEPANIATLGKYLSASHGLLGLIVGRQSASPGLNATLIALLENEQKIVLTLDISILRDMLEYKAGGINPVFLLQDRYQMLIASAGG